MFEIMIYFIAISSVVLITLIFLYILILNPRQLHLLEKCIDNKLYVEAEILLLKMLRKDSQNCNLLYQLAYIYCETDRKNKAIPLYEQIIKLKNISPTIKSKTLYELVQYYQNINLLKKANHYMEQLLEMDPNNTQYLMMLGNIYYEIKDYKSANNIFHKLCLLDPNNSLYLQRLGDTYNLLNMNNLSYKYYNLALNQDPQNAKLLFKLGEICEKMQDYTQAIEFYYQIEKYNNNNNYYYYIFYAHRNLASIFFQLQNHETAIKHLEKARIMILNNTIQLTNIEDILDTYYQIGQYYLDNQNIHLALTEWERILKIDHTYKNVQELYNTYFSLQINDFFKDIVTLSGDIKQQIISVFLSTLGYTITSIQTFGEDVLDFYVSNGFTKWADISKKKIIFSFWCSTNPFPMDVILRLIDSLDTHANITKIFIISAGPILSDIRTLSAKHPIYLYDQNNIQELYNAQKNK